MIFPPLQRSRKPFLVHFSMIPFVEKEGSVKTFRYAPIYNELFSKRKATDLVAFVGNLARKSIHKCLNFFFCFPVFAYEATYFFATVECYEAWNTEDALVNT